MPATANKLQPELSVDVVIEDDRWNAIANVEKLVSETAEAVAPHLPARDRMTAAVLLTSDDHIASLNEQFRGKKGPTNVLSFPSGSGDGLGDIALAFETVRREAEEQEVAIADHVRHLVVHGLLHLCGYDHDTSEAAESMENLEIRILSTLGVANPYTAPLETDKTE